MPGLPDVGGLPSRAGRDWDSLPMGAAEKRKAWIMAKDRVKQRAHLRCGMTKEERLRREVFGGLGEGLDRKNYYGLSDPTPYKAIKNMIRKGERLI